MTGRRAGAAARGLAALVTLLLLVVGLPAVLYRFGGSPLPHRVPSAHQVTAALLRRDTGSLFFAAVRDVSWVAWALFSLAVVTEVIAAIGGRQAPRLRLGGLQNVAGQLVALAALTFTSPATALLAATPSAPVVMTTVPAVHPPGHRTTAGPGEDGAGEHASPRLTGLAADQSASPPAVPQVMSMASYQAVVVRPGECLWTIAQRYLGDGDRYPEIVSLNMGHAMGGGQVFSDPAMIWPGWVLQLPATASPASQPPPDQPAHHPSHPSRDPRFSRPHRAASPAGPGRVAASGPASHPRATASPARSGGQTTSYPVAGRHSAAGPARSLGQAASGAAGSGGPASRVAADPPPLTQQEELPPIAVFAAGMLAGGVMVSVARMRHRQRQARRPGRRIPMPASAPVMQAERRLRTVSPPQPATALRAALGRLGSRLAADGQQLPAIAGIHLTQSAMELLLASPASEPPPPPFSVPGGRQGMAWHLALPAGAPPPDPGSQVARGDLLPGLLTAGIADDAGGYLLIDLEHLRVTSVEGPQHLVSRVLAAAAAELATSELAGWYNLILCGYSELEAAGGRATTCDNLDEALDLLAARAVTVARRLGDGGSADVRCRRIAEPDDEDWALSLLVSRVAPTAAQLSFLTDIASEPGGIAALVAGGEGDPDGSAAPASFLLSADPDRPGGIVAQIFPMQLEVRPQALTGQDYQAIVSLFETALDPGDVAPDFPPYDGSGWAATLGSASWPEAPDGALPDGALRPGPGEDLADPLSDGGPLRGEDPADPLSDGGPVAGDYPLPGLFAGPDLAGPDDYPLPDLPGVGEYPAPAVPGQVGYSSPAAPGEQEQAGIEDYQVPAASGQPERNVIPGPRQAAAGPPAPAAVPVPAGMLRIGILGSFTINGAAGALLPAQSQLILALALNGAVGLSNPQLGYLLGADPDHPKPSDSLRQLIARTRRQLGPAPGGAEWIVHLGGGQYSLHPDARLDWADFSALAERGLAARDRGDLREALALVRGQPFSDCYHWWLDLAFVETVRAQIVDVAEMLAALELEANDASASARAARAGLAGDVAAEQLWRALMRAEHVAGNLSGVREAWNHCLGVIADIAPGGEPHPDTAALYQELLRSAASRQTRSRT